MTVYQTRLNDRQERIRDHVCRAAPNLNGRLEALIAVAHYEIDPTGDVAAVKRWLIDMHHEELPKSPRIRFPEQSAVAAIERATRTAGH